MRKITKVERGARKVVYHGVLAFGSFLFAIPFIWLVSTSCKVPDEMYPPKWIPQVPGGVTESPYIGIRENERATKPVNVKRGDWERVKGAAMAAISAVAKGMEGEFPEFYGPYLGEEDLAEGIFARLVKRAPDEVFEMPDEEAAAWFRKGVNAEIVGQVFEAVYRRAAISEVVFHGWDVVTVEHPTETKEFPWEVAGGDVVLVDRRTGLLRPAKEMAYSFAEQETLRVSGVFPLEMPAENLKKAVVSMHGDRSWHEIWAVIEFGGRRFEAAEAAFFNSDRWQDITWQFRGGDEDPVEMRTWIWLKEAGESEFSEDGKVRITVEVRHGGQLRAALNKYVNNYREVLRRVPLFAYMRNSVFLVVLNIVGQILGSSLVAFSFARLKWPGREFCFALVLATLMIPPQVTMIPVFLIFRSLGFYNTLRPLWVPSFFGSAFYIFLLRQFMKGIPMDLEDSAKIDGCGYLGIYWRIILPLIKPALAAIGIFTFQHVWNDFMGPLIYLSDQELYTLSLGLFSLQVFQGGNFGLMMAASVVMTVPVIALFFAAQRNFIQGVNLTGLKG
jgi:ABC-type glycerol-3-phosphate transport system permease component